MSRFSDGVRSLRSRLQQVSKDNAPTVVHVCSALPHEGKTTLSICLAASAALAGQRAVVVDCDLRQMSLTRTNKLQGLPGVTDFVHKNAALQAVTHYAAALGVTVVPAGAGTIDPQFALSSQRMRDLIAGLRQSFEFIVIDSPALDAVLDGALLANLADTTLFVIRWNGTSLRIAQQALNTLGGKAERTSAALNLFDPAWAASFDPIAFNFTANSYQSYYSNRQARPADPAPARRDGAHYNS